MPGMPRPRGSPTSRLGADPDRPGRVWLAGALTPPALAAALTAATVMHWPDRSLVLTLERLLEGAVPQIALFGLALAAALAGLGRVRLALVLACLNLAGLAQVARHVWLNSDPPQAAAPVHSTVLWFNVLKDNKTSPARLIAALADSPADIVVLGEAVPLRAHLDDPALTAAFPVQAGCRGRRCELLALARDPAARITIRKLYPPRVERMLRVESPAGPNGPGLSVLAMHFHKPWYFGIAEHDNWYGVDEIGRTRGPMAVIGDFNAAPWSHRLRTLYRLCGVRNGQRWPRPTWPRAAGPLGVPIDQVLTRGGAQVVSVRTWGGDLGSNHSGLLVDLAVTDAPPSAREDCRIPLDAQGYPVRPVQP